METKKDIENPSYTISTKPFGVALFRLYEWTSKEGFWFWYKELKHKIWETEGINYYNTRKAQMQGFFDLTTKYSHRCIIVPFDNYDSTRHPKTRFKNPLEWWRRENK